MMFSIATLVALPGVFALPGDKAFSDRIAAFRSGLPEEPCTTGLCAKPTKRYERILNTMPGVQWGDAGGYCGSWSIQRAAMAKGAWISQQQVREHTVAGGGNDNEILATNIEVALSNLKLKFEAFDYKHLPTPQLDAGRKWMKRQLVAGNPLVQMIMLPGSHYPVYPGLPYGFYSHIEPIVGIMSDRPLVEDDFYDGDYIVHYDDVSTVTMYRNMSSLPGEYDGKARCPGNDGTGRGQSEMCLHPEYVFSWAIQGFTDTREGMPISLTVDPWKSEPDIRSGESPAQLSGTVTMEGLTVGVAYALYRWDSVEKAFDYSLAAPVFRFLASNVTTIYKDPQTFSSDGTIYYRCIADSSLVL